MKRYPWLICCIIILACADAAAITYYENTSIGSFVDSNIIIASGVTVSQQDETGIAMNDVVSLYNNGAISGTINTNGNNLYIYNTVNNATINVTGGGNVVQKISAGNQITRINLVGDDFGIHVENMTNLNLSDIQNMNASSFRITESSIVMDDFNSWQNWNKPVVLDGNITLIINNADSVNSGTVINHTLGGSTINVTIPDLDRMYKPQLEYNGSEIILHIVRETNYGLVFDDSDTSENVLDQIRKRHPHDKLLRALDSADSIEEINRLKGLSYRFNHDILLRPLKMMNKFSSMTLLKNESDSGAGLEPFYIMSDKIDTVGGRAHVGYSDDSLYFNAGLSIGRFNYSDDLNEFSGITYGGDIKSKQTMDKFWLAESVGLSLTDFSADYVSQSGVLKKNPLGLSGYGDVSAGYDFVIEQDITLAPIVGLTYQQYKVADVSDSDAYFHGGADIKYFFVMDGIKYEYSASAAVATNGDMFANAKIGFVSVTDNAGVSFNAGILKDDFDCYYRFSLDAMVLF